MPESDDDDLPDPPNLDDEPWLRPPKQWQKVLNFGKTERGREMRDRILRRFHEEQEQKEKEQDSGDELARRRHRRKP